MSLMIIEIGAVLICKNTYNHSTSVSADRHNVHRIRAIRDNALTNTAHQHNMLTLSLRFERRFLVRHQQRSTDTSASVTNAIGSAYTRTLTPSDVPLDESIAAFNAICDGDYDHFPEQAFFMCGGLEDLKNKAKELGVS